MWPARQISLQRQQRNSPSGEIPGDATHDRNVPLGRQRASVFVKINTLRTRRKTSLGRLCGHNRGAFVEFIEHGAVGHVYAMAEQQVRLLPDEVAAVARDLV